MKISRRNITNPDRTKDINAIKDVLEELGEKDIRVGQAIIIAINKQKVDLFSIENDQLLKLLQEANK